MVSLLSKIGISVVTNPKLLKKIVSIVAGFFAGILILFAVMFLPIASLFGPAIETVDIIVTTAGEVIDNLANVVGTSVSNLGKWLGIEPLESAGESIKDSGSNINGSLSEIPDQLWDAAMDNSPALDDDYDITQSNLYIAIYPVYLEECQKINKQVDAECQRIHSEHQEFDWESMEWECTEPEPNYTKINSDMPEHIAILMTYLSDNENLLDRAFGFIWSKAKVRRFFEKYATVTVYWDTDRYNVEFQYPYILDDNGNLTDSHFKYPYNKHWENDINGGGKARNGTELFELLGLDNKDGYGETSYAIFLDFLKTAQAAKKSYTGTPSGHISNSEVAKQVWDFFKGKGWTDYACAALLGNIEQESSFNLNARTSKDIGLFQWTDNKDTKRMSNFLNWCNKNGKTWNTVEAQCEYLIVENTWYTAMYRSGTFSHSSRATGLQDFGTRTYDQLKDAVSDFLWHWESPSYKSANEDRRQGAAQDALDKFGTYLSVNVAFHGTKAQKLAAIYPNGIPTNEWEAQASCVTIPVVTTTGEKNVTVNKAVAKSVQAIFADIKDSGFEITDVQGYAYREKSEASGLSTHSYGLALDINVAHNGQYAIKDGIRDELPNVGGPWDPINDPLSIASDGPVVKAFELYGWTWGGKWTSKKDYMHFSLLGD
ncbi:MAG: M15 family metallopeptidase [Enterocloster asparagiformis]|nr:M15 family metallopeptidase [Enterocloster asparagiformis]